MIEPHVTERIKKVTESIKTHVSIDVLKDVLETLQFKGSVFFESELSSPWGLSLEKSTSPRFHVAVTGNFHVGVSDCESIEINEKNLVLIPGGVEHWIADKPGRKLVASNKASIACEIGEPFFANGEVSNVLICGLVKFDRNVKHPIFDALPSLIKILQIHVRDNDVNFGFLAALRDRRIYRALELIHDAPERNWTLDMLGEGSGMSRATLARKFQEILGVSPMAYLNNWRVMRAYSLVKYSSTPLDKVAEATGFASSKTLTKAFKRCYGISPAILRKEKPWQLDQIR
jgi:AraC-like DNA-binding protein